MRQYRRKILYPTLCNEYDPKTDTPLAYFSVNKAFVRKRKSGSLFLFGNGYHMVLLDHRGWIYTVTDFDHFDREIVQAFLQEYAPTVNIDDLAPSHRKLQFVYIEDFKPLQERENKQ